MGRKNHRIAGLDSENRLDQRVHLCLRAWHQGADDPDRLGNPDQPFFRHFLNHADGLCVFDIVKDATAFFAHLDDFGLHIAEAAFVEGELSQFLDQRFIGDDFPDDGGSQFVNLCLGEAGGDFLRRTSPLHQLGDGLFGNVR